MCCSDASAGLDNGHKQVATCTENLVSLEVSFSEICVQICRQIPGGGGAVHNNVKETTSAVSISVDNCVQNYR